MLWTSGLFLFPFLGLLTAQTVIYDINTQANCTEVQRGSTSDCRWVAGLNMVDELILKGRIIAYRIEYSTDKWSEWYVPGINDLSPTYNPEPMQCSIPYRENSMRRRWALFYDHTHRYLICKP